MALHQAHAAGCRLFHNQHRGRIRDHVSGIIGVGVVEIAGTVDNYDWYYTAPRPVFLIARKLGTYFSKCP